MPQTVTINLDLEFLRPKIRAMMEDIIREERRDEAEKVIHEGWHDGEWRLDCGRCAKEMIEEERRASEA